MPTISQNQVDIVVKAFGLNQLETISKQFTTLSLASQRAAREVMQSWQSSSRGAVMGIDQIRAKLAGLKANAEAPGRIGQFDALIASLNQLQQMILGTVPVTQSGLASIMRAFDSLTTSENNVLSGQTQLIENFRRLGVTASQGFNQIDTGAKKLQNSMKQLKAETEQTNTAMAGMENRGRGAALSLNVLSAGGAGFMAATSAMQGNIVGMAFGLIFLKFAIIEVSIAIAGLTVGLAVLHKVIAGSIKAFKGYEETLFSFEAQLGSTSAALGDDQGWSGIRRPECIYG